VVVTLVASVGFLSVVLGDVKEPKMSSNRNGDEVELSSSKSNFSSSKTRWSISSLTVSSTTSLMVSLEISVSSTGFNAPSIILSVANSITVGVVSSTSTLGLGPNLISGLTRLTTLSGLGLRGLVTLSGAGVVLLGGVVLLAGFSVTDVAISVLSSFSLGLKRVTEVGGSVLGRRVGLLKGGRRLTALLTSGTDARDGSGSVV